MRSDGSSGCPRAFSVSKITWGSSLSSNSMMTNWRAAKKESADRYSANVLPVIREIQRSGDQSLCGIARALAARGIQTARGGEWTAVQVSDILDRAG